MKPAPPVTSTCLDEFMDLCRLPAGGFRMLQLRGLIGNKNGKWIYRRQADLGGPWAVSCPLVGLGPWVSARLVSRHCPILRLGPFDAPQHYAGAISFSVLARRLALAFACFNRLRLRFERDQPGLLPENWSSRNGSLEESSS